MLLSGGGFAFMHLPKLAKLTVRIAAMSELFSNFALNKNNNFHV